MVGGEGDQPIADSGELPRPLRRRGEGAGDLAGRDRLFGDPRDRRVEAGIERRDAGPFRKRHRKVRRADEDAVYAGDRQNRLKRLQRPRRFDHGEGKRLGVGGFEMGLRVFATQAHRPTRPPAPLAEQRILGGRHQRPRLRLRIDHRGDHPFRAHVEDAAGERIVTERQTHQRRLAGKRHRADPLNDGAGVMKAVLDVKGDAIEAGAGDRVRDQRLGQGRPCGEEGVAGTEARRESGHGAAPLTSRCGLAPSPSA